MWIWLESSVCLVRSVFFLTPSSDLGPSSSQPVHEKSPVSITVCTISAASTGIGYYYCIYINISLYILRRSKRQTFETSPRIIVFVCLVSNCPLRYKKDGARLSSGFVECPEVRAFHGTDTAHVMQAGAHAVCDAVTQRLIAGGRAGVFFLAGLLQARNFFFRLA